MFWRVSDGRLVMGDCVMMGCLVCDGDACERGGVGEGKERGCMEGCDGRACTRRMCENLSRAVEMVC